ncbi:MAG TPA: hypothetical protein VGZ22_06715 [Isosphaeraceae bacterium]|jgi:hypothetical protein|nr:hypothetical protein [Isosphaeraceae bacterium]
MPLKLSIGLSRKVGQPDFGSLGASCGVEIELESSLLDRDREGFHRRVRELYALCAQSVDEELASHQRTVLGPHVNSRGPQERNGHANGLPGNGSRSRAERPATPSQVRALHAIANDRHLDLAGLLAERFGASRADELSIADASHLIEELQNGAGTPVQRP